MSSPPITDAAIVETLQNEHGQEIVRLRVAGAGHNAVVDVHVFGAHVTCWSDAGATCCSSSGCATSDCCKDSLLFLSEKAHLDGSKAIRGGVPICFPQFSGFGPLPSHGFARTSMWRFSGSNVDENVVTATFTLTDNEETRSMWPHAFECRYHVTLYGGIAQSSLSLKMEVENRNETGSMPFACALHTYFSVGDIGSVSVSPMKGLRYLDQLQGTVEEAAADTVSFESEVDSIYFDTPDTLQVTDRSQSGRAVTCTKKGMSDAVVWNPWVAKSQRMEDFGDDEYKNMVCVEAATCLSEDKKLTLAPGETWTGTVELSYESLKL